VNVAGMMVVEGRRFALRSEARRVLAAMAGKVVQSFFLEASGLVFRTPNSECARSSFIASFGTRVIGGLIGLELRYRYGLGCGFMILTDRDSTPHERCSTQDINVR
jgi:hypothetical protein